MSESELDLTSGINAFEAKDFTLAMRLLSPLADEGNPEAQYRMGMMYQNGLGKVKNDDYALKYMQASADQGHAYAQHGMGIMYLYGECV
jgi:TPR repeat protein